MGSKNPQSTGPDKETTDGSKSLSKTKKMTPEEQSAQFIQTARELECDESLEGFEEAIQKILPQQKL